MKLEFFFLRAFSICKTIGFLFLFLPKELATDDGITDELYSNGRIPSMN
jgi:hypothetical protein